MLRGILFCAVLFAPLPGVAETKIDSLSWIAGHWSGPMGRAEGEEHWTAPSGGAMLGVSRTVARDRMVAFEFLRIVERPDGIFYMPQPGGRPPVEFKLTRFTEDTAVFENPTHDHPKIITYRLEDGGAGMVVTIEGDEKGQPKKTEFRFRRLAECPRSR